jgi:pimeloyl-ACP methyl ester carboxylesterase
MSAKTSVKYYRPAGKSQVIFRRVISLAVVFSLLVLLAGVASFSAASQLMRQAPAPLISLTSNVLPPFSAISFPSLDEQTTLSGWLFPARGDPVSTVILVHDSGRNRLQFGLDTPALYEFFVNNHYNVLAFDLRHAGQSAGLLSAYGYAEWEDVLAAVSYARRFTTTRDVLLYGFGSGVTATLLAWARLPETTVGSSQTVPAAQAGTAFDNRIKNLGFDRSYIRGILLDTPCVQSEAYIRARYRQAGLGGRLLLQYTVPYAVRLSASSQGPDNLATILTQIQKPVFLACSASDTYVGNHAIEPLIRERQRLHPDTTIVYIDPTPGYVAGFQNNQEAYLGAVADYLARFIG